MVTEKEKRAARKRARAIPLSNRKLAQEIAKDINSYVKQGFPLVGARVLANKTQQGKRETYYLQLRFEKDESA